MQASVRPGLIHDSKASFLDYKVEPAHLQGEALMTLGFTPTTVLQGKPQWLKNSSTFKHSTVENNYLLNLVLEFSSMDALIFVPVCPGFDLF